MRKKIGFKKRFKAYWTKKPESDFWLNAFITLFLFRYVAPTVLYFSTFFQLGLITPEIDFTPIMEKTSKSLADNFMIIMQRMYEVGQGIALNNPLVAKILFYALSYLIWVIWIAVIFLVLNLLRFGVSYIYRKLTHKR
jgi:hypothetical protein